MSLHHRPALECDAPGCRAVRHAGRALDGIPPAEAEREMVAEAVQFGWSEMPVPASPDGPARTVHYCAMHRPATEQKAP